MRIRRPRPHGILAGLLCLPWAAALAWCQPVSAQVAVTARVAPEAQDGLQVAEAFRYEVHVSAPPGTRVEPPRPDLMPGTSFAVVEALPAQGRDTGDGQEWVFPFQLRALAEGEQDIAGLTVLYRLPGERQTATAEVPPVAVQVTLVPGDERAPLIAMPSGPPYWLGTAVVAALVLAALVVAAWMFMAARRHRDRPAAAAQPLLVAAHERALRELALLSQATEAEGGEFHTRLSEIMREYLEARYGIRAMEQTTWMTARELEDLGIAAELRKRLVEVLRACDAVKYAGILPRPEESSGDLARAREAVEMTRPAPEPTPGAEDESVAAGQGVR